MRLPCTPLLASAVPRAALGAGFAGAAEDHRAREWAAGCLGCHHPAANAIPSLNGQPRDEIAAKFRAFRDGRQTGTVMPQLAKGYSDAQIDAIAAWFAAAPAR